MIQIRDSLRRRKASPEVNISPLIDLVFLLLIFFMVTTSFVKETGIDINRPNAETAVVSKQQAILVGIADNGEVHFDGKAIDIRSVRLLVARAVADKPDADVVVVADKAAPTGILVRVMDQCRLAGAERVSVATQNKGER
ncbi:ExbD/TolR family protein [Ferrimonas kyonanensis]|uniref:ExbD/TolR family protein n=1 Tax=Ferrimonas kyonanensis TaxID=364763 RepID=UPI0004072D83|nr:biopolymer transporter ExbD [Ferrimonas kyonanensis]